MAQPEKPGLDLGCLLDAAGATTQATRGKAADLVEDYVHEKVAPALTDILTAAERGERPDDQLAAEITAASRLVEAEVTRFWGLARSS